VASEACARGRPSGTQGLKARLALRARVAFIELVFCRRVEGSGGQLGEHHLCCQAQNEIEGGWPPPHQENRRRKAADAWDTAACQAFEQRRGLGC
jgi:hypothetical protein